VNRGAAVGLAGMLQRLFLHAADPWLSAGEARSSAAVISRQASTHDLAALKLADWPSVACGAGMAFRRRAGTSARPA